jgi:hypothetical protein
LRKPGQQFLHQACLVEPNVHPLRQVAKENSSILLGWIKRRKKGPMILEPINSGTDASRDEIIPKLRENAVGNLRSRLRGSESNFHHHLSRVKSYRGPDAYLRSAVSVPPTVRSCRKAVS